jgi:uncharacterized membrane protein
MRGTGRLEAFSDGGMSIIIPIMAVALIWLAPATRIERALIEAAPRGYDARVGA